MDWRVGSAITMMKDNLHRELPLCELAQAVGLSSSRLQHLFKAETGTTPAHYLHSLRLERARELFETTLLSVKQVMNRVGITDRSHFDREFKSIYDLPPAQYRTSVRRGVLVKKHKSGASQDQP